MKTKKIYNPPITEMVEVEFEGGFMKSSVFDPENNHDKGLKTEEHGFANPETDFEGDYGEGTWD